MHFTHYNDDCYIEYVTRVNGPDDKWHDSGEGDGGGNNGGGGIHKTRTLSASRALKKAARVDDLCVVIVISVRGGGNELA